MKFPFEPSAEASLHLSLGRVSGYKRIFLRIRFSDSVPMINRILDVRRFTLKLAKWPTS